MSAAPILRYPGSKWRLAPLVAKLLEQLPHRVYLEPYLGSGAVFFTRRPAPVELLNDQDSEVVNLFAVLRDPATAEQLAGVLALTPYSEVEWRNSLRIDVSLPSVERARRLLLRAWQSHGQRLGSRTGWAHDGKAGAKRLRGWLQLPDRALACVERLRHAQLFCRDALSLISDYASPEVAIYADPPYLGEVRNTTGALYRCEMRDPKEHEQLLSLLVAHPGPVVLSGYAHPLYESALKGWPRLICPAVADTGAYREEILWVNRPLKGQQSLFGGAL